MSEVKQMARIRLQFDEGHIFVDLPDMPRMGEGIVLPRPHIESVFRVADVVHYAADASSLAPPQRADVRVLGTLADGPRA